MLTLPSGGHIKKNKKKKKVSLALMDSWNNLLNPKSWKRVCDN